jgi:hypothetical protein
MKPLNQIFIGKRRSLKAIILVCAVVGLAVRSEAQTNLLTHRNSSVLVDTGSGTLVDWLVDGVDLVNQQSFHFRVGSVGGESMIGSINSTPSVAFDNAFPRQLDVTYANSNYSVRVLYLLTGGTAGTGGSALSEGVTVANTSSSPLDFHFYQYSDFDLGGLSGNQAVQFYTNGAGQYYKVIQLGNGQTVTETINSAAPLIGHFEAATYNQTLAGLNDADPTTLSDSVSAIGNATFAYQWDVTLAPGDSFQVSKLLAVALDPSAIVPEPSAFALVSLGLLVFGFRRRNRRV